MLLGLSALTTGHDVEVEAASGSAHGPGGVVSGQLLTEFVEATLDPDPSDLPIARANLADELGGQVVDDAAGVIAIFQLMNRVANATGTPLDEPIAAQAEDLSTHLEFSKYPSYEASSASFEDPRSTPGPLR